MKIEYFSDTDTLYIDLSGRESVESQEIGAGIILDLDAEGLPAGLDIDNASKHLGLDKLSFKGVPFEVEQAG